MTMRPAYVVANEGAVPRPGIEIAAGLDGSTNESSMPEVRVHSVSAGAGGTTKDGGEVGARA